jgi:hypothetical protein
MKVCFTVSEIARFFQVDESEVFDWIGREGLPARSYHKKTYVHRVDLLEWLSSMLNHRDSYNRLIYGSDGLPGIDPTNGLFGPEVVPESARKAH